MDHPTPSAPRKGGLSFAPYFAWYSGNPLESVAWESRDIRVEDWKTKEVVFAQDGFRVPASWSENAGTIVASKFAFGPPGRRETGVDKVIARVACAITKEGLRGGYFATGTDALTFRRELIHLLVHQYGSFNSPVWFNVGIDHAHGLDGTGTCWYWDEKARIPGGFRDDETSYLGQATVKIRTAFPDRFGKPVQTTQSYVHPQASACFIQGVEDTMESIMALATSEAMLFKHGSGSGTDLSKLRSTKETLSTGGKPSGPVSFMRIYDATAAVIKSGGKTRRAAKMQTLRCDHPDILEFVHAKGNEERKAKALVAAGYSDGMDGEAYRTVAFQNANLSVGITDEFMRWLDEPHRGDLRAWKLIGPTTGNPVAYTQATEIMDGIAAETWECGDPGVQFIDTINSWHTCPNSGPIVSSNPCSEYVFVNETACNLASLRLTRFRLADGGFDVPAFKAATRVFITAMDILVDLGSSPTEAICRGQHDHRTLGLGYADLGGLLMEMGIPYDSDLGRQWAGAITALLTGESYRVSAELAAGLGAFPAFAKNREPMLKVLERHQVAAEHLTYGAIAHDIIPGRLADVGRKGWIAFNEAIYFGRRHGGYRNAQVTLLAPTGTIGFMMDCDTTGVEPSCGLKTTKTLAGGGNMKVACRSVQSGLRSLGFGEDRVARALAYLDKEGEFSTYHDMSESESDVFRTALAPNRSAEIPYMGHLAMMAAVQPFLSGAISKTVNVPSSFTVADIAATYKLAWEMGLKCVAIYRDGSKGGQPISVDRPTETTVATIACHKCGSPNLAITGTCSTCSSCGEPQGGCS